MELTGSNAAPSLLVATALVYRDGSRPHFLSRDWTLPSSFQTETSADGGRYLLITLGTNNLAIRRRELDGERH